MLKVLDVSKTYKNKSGNVKALNKINFEIEPGEICCYIGPNGAGKSTTIKAILGLLKIDEGKILFNDVEVTTKRNNKMLKAVGVCIANKTQLIWDVPVIDSLTLIGKIYSVPKKVISERIDTLSRKLRIDHILKKTPKQISLGERVKADIIASLIHSPSFVLMDEPTIGLDIISKKNILEFIVDEQKKNNTSFLITTHDMSWMEKIHSRIVVINQGNLIFNGYIQELKKIQNNLERYVLEFGDENLDEIINKFKPLDLEIKQVNNSIDFSSNNHDTIVKVIEFCFSNYKVINIKNMSDSNLESMILKLTT